MDYEAKIQELEAIQLVQSALLSAILESGISKPELLLAHLMQLESAVLNSQSSDRKTSLILEMVEDFRVRLAVNHQPGP